MLIYCFKIRGLWQTCRSTEYLFFIIYKIFLCEITMQTKLHWEVLAFLSTRPCYEPASLTHMKEPLCVSLYLEADIPVAYWTAHSFQTLVPL